MPIVTLTTDFGPADGYVAAVKGVLLTMAPGVTLVDITHHVPAQSVLGGAYVLSTAYNTFPAGSIHLVVVDPGVGGSGARGWTRRAVAVRTARYSWVAPDNGVLSLALAREPVQQAVTLTRPAYWRREISSTFHGRDVLAPVAAHLANGVPLEVLGEPIDDLMPLPIAAPVHDGARGIRGHVLHVDHFGNIITDIPAELLAGVESWRVELKGVTVSGPYPAYSAVPVGALVSLIGSHGELEIAMREGDAAAALGVRAGDEVYVSPSSGG